MMSWRVMKACKQALVAFPYATYTSYVVNAPTLIYLLRQFAAKVKRCLQYMCCMSALYPIHLEWSRVCCDFALFVVFFSVFGFVLVYFFTCRTFWCCTEVVIASVLFSCLKGALRFVYFVCCHVVR